eukprot:TRINITY_DN113840_c0_g1_i1.p2 TRINITY_DN113840_c0_g1~~TRINITY_DN113840_c0_g1_i1.p2  ORF type:complete len:187 (-),score=78.92 TRINITY_DN113840_c0_g1_i1:136-696(-)
MRAVLSLFFFSQLVAGIHHDRHQVFLTKASRSGNETAAGNETPANETPANETPAPPTWDHKEDGGSITEVQDDKTYHSNFTRDDNPVFPKPEKADKDSEAADERKEDEVEKEVEEEREAMKKSDDDKKKKEKKEEEMWAPPSWPSTEDSKDKEKKAEEPKARSDSRVASALSAQVALAAIVASFLH